MAYLGDAVYVEPWEAGHGVRLYTTDGVSETNVIFLEDAVVHSLLKYLEEARFVKITPFVGGA